MRSGTVQLRSGKWEWQTEVATLGSKLVFKRWGSQAGEEMIAWVPSHDITEKLAEECARDPLHRNWVDEVGLTWKLSIESMRPWRMSDAEGGTTDDGDSVAVVFTRGWHKLAAKVPRDTHLGELTQGELVRLLEGAAAW